MTYRHGIPPPGKSISDFWIKSMDDQAGLEGIPSSNPDPAEQDRRELAVFNGIKAMLDLQNLPFIICLQECDQTLYNRLDSIARDKAFRIETSRPSEEKSYCAMLVSSSFNHMRVSQHPQRIAVRLPGFQITICCVHLDFQTTSNLNHIEELFLARGENGLIIAGDYNVQSQPLHPDLIAEGKCTATLTEFADMLQVKTQMTPLFALHPDGFTNWNVRKNCADREHNADHFDHIMLLSENFGSITMEPVDVDILMY
jgi:hypothetical protein